MLRRADTLGTGRARRPLLALRALRTGRAFSCWSRRSSLPLLAFRAGYPRRTRRSLVAPRALRTGRTLFALGPLGSLTTSSEKQGQRKNHKGS
jgi:hypothetical protein